MNDIKLNFKNVNHCKINKNKNETKKIKILTFDSNKSDKSSYSDLLGIFHENKINLLKEIQLLDIDYNKKGIFVKVKNKFFEISQKNLFTEKKYEIKNFLLRASLSEPFYNKNSKINTNEKIKENISKNKLYLINQSYEKFKSDNLNNKNLENLGPKAALNYLKKNIVYKLNLCKNKFSSTVISSSESSIHKK